MSDEMNRQLPPCPRCGMGMRPGKTKTVIWVEDRVYFIEDIPAHMCDSCVEQFYDDETTDMIRRMEEEGFPAADLKREILVPVYSLERRIHRFDAPSEEQQESPVAVEA